MLNYRKDGTSFWNALSVTPLFDEPGVPVQFVGVMRDVTARRHAEAQLLLAGKLFEQSSEGFIVTDASCRIVKVTQAFTAICGYTEAGALGQNPRLLASGRHEPAFFQAMWAEMWAEMCSRGHWQGEVWNRRRDGSVCLQWLSEVRQAPDAVLGLLAPGDVAEGGDVVRRLACCVGDLAHRHLTGLPNRAVLHDRVMHALQMSSRSKEPMALMFIDLDHFKNVNDALGHDAGGGLLVAVTKRFNAALRDQGTN